MILPLKQESKGARPFSLADVRARLVGGHSLFSPSELYHENSRITRATPSLAQSPASLGASAYGFKRYVHSRRWPLPQPVADRGVSLWNAIEARHSCRSFADAPIALPALASLTHFALGICGDGRRCLPSAGGLYPLELYVAVARVEGLLAGLYHYDVRTHALAELGRSDSFPVIADAVFIPAAVEHAAAVLLLSAVFGRSKVKYGERAYRFALLEAGHAIQNVLLTAAGLGLGACPVGGFIDDALNDHVGVDGVDEAVLYAVIVGVPA